jgi:hypothetical protein
MLIFPSRTCGRRLTVSVKTVLRTCQTAFEAILFAVSLLIIMAMTIFLCGVPFYLIYGLAFQLGEVAGLYKIDDIAVHYFHLGLLGLIVPAIGLALVWIRRVWQGKCRPNPLLKRLMRPVPMPPPQ